MTRLVWIFFTCSIFGMIYAPLHAVSEEGLRVPSPLRKIGCKELKILGANGELELYKYKASGHLAGSDRANSCSLIYGYGNYSFPTRLYFGFYDLRGNLLGRFKRYSLFGDSYAGRWYTTGNGRSCSAIALTAYRRTRKYTGIVRYGNGTCLKVLDIRKRQGRV